MEFDRQRQIKTLGENLEEINRLREEISTEKMKRLESADVSSVVSNNSNSRKSFLKPLGNAVPMSPSNGYCNIMI
jgi:hypothetical protein